ncbi:8521_t:CDS:2 [Funneliformis caledonium]|uniref:8521_t:CDS:1 n=1 Tax=Funneliformis caledonium TaxID=1117310 RepID=A0A9N9F8C4_9GLOM|nr:8521_t:CDS:2 [Funneliformis caledonium]
MELPKYNGTCHPNTYVKNMRAYCKINRITNAQDILELSILMIDSNIIIPEDIDNIDKLVNTLKSHSTFNIFKDSCKGKLQGMKYIPEEEENFTATFLAKFRTLCNDAEINDPYEIKKLLFNTYSSNIFFKEEFVRLSDIMNSKDQIDEICKLFHDIVFDASKIIKYDSLIALKNVSTGRYLSSCNINYITGSTNQVVFAGEKLPDTNALWFLKNCSKKEIPYNIESKFKLMHKETNKELFASRKYKSPTTGQGEVSCRTNDPVEFQFINLKPKNNHSLYLRANDLINLKAYNTQYKYDRIVRDHYFTFTIGDEVFYEIVGHNDRIGANDAVC